jgi:hypothetical protein
MKTPLIDGKLKRWLCIVIQNGPNPSRNMTSQLGPITFHKVTTGIHPSRKNISTIYSQYFNLFDKVKP